MARFVAIDTGGTAIKYALMDEEANIIDQGEVPTPHESLDAYVETLGSIYDKYADENPEAMVMAAPGKIDADRGYFYTGGALQYIHETDLAGALKERIPVPFCAENDAKAAALAELWKGSMKDNQNGVVMTLGTGIGGAVILDGKLYRGTNFAAGEFSGIATNWNSRMSGHDENFALINGVGGLTKRYANVKYNGKQSVNGREFFEDYLSGSDEAARELQWYCTTLATAIYSLQLVLDVEKFAFGGGISRQPALLEALNKEVDNLFERMPFYAPATKPEVVACEFSSDANLVGALYHYLYEYKPALAQ